MKLNFILADDRIEALNSTSNYIKKILKENNIYGAITLCTTNTVEVLEYSRSNYKEINVYILDINFNDDINGFELARAIREKEPNAYIIFLTVHVQLSMLTFKYRLKVFDFLIKPIAYKDLEDCIKGLQEDYLRVVKYEMPLTQSFVNVKSGHLEHQIPIGDIVYIESYGPKVVIHMKEGELETYGTLREIEASISEITNSFHRSHKSYLINLKEIKEIKFQQQEIIMSTDEKCLLSRAQKKFFKEYQERLK